MLELKRTTSADDALTSGKPIEVVDETHFDGVVKVLHRAKTGWLRTKTGVFAVRPRMLQVPADDCLFSLEVVDSPEGNIEDLEIDALELSFGDAVFSLEGSAVRLQSGALQVHRPQRVFSKGLASMVVSPGLVRLRWSVGKLRIYAEVLEISMNELLVDGAGPSIVPGTPRPAILELFENGREHPVEIECMVDVCAGPPAPDSARLQLRVDEDRADLVRLFRLLRFPQLVDRGALPRADVVDLFERSQYLTLRETDQVDPSDAWCCPDFASDLSIDTIFRAEDGALLGHVSVTRAYSRTWLGHQLATLKGHTESAMCRQALYRHFACVPLLSDGEDCFLLGYYDRALRWHRLFFESFVDWIGDERHAAVVAFDRFEPAADDAPRASIAEESDITVQPLHPLDLPEALDIVRGHLPQLAVDAFDIDAEHLCSDALHPDYASRGVQRARHVLTLHEDGRVVGVALCETGSRHLSLFNLLNMAQVYTSSAHPPSRAARAHLLQQVRAFYNERGVTDPVVVAPPGSMPEPGDAGLQIQETMGCILWSGRSLLQYQSFISYCFAKIGTRSLTSGAKPSTGGQ